MRKLFLFIVAVSVLALPASGDWTIDAPMANAQYSTTSNFDARGKGESQYTAAVTFCRHSGVVECSRSAPVADDPEEWLIDGDERFEPTTAWTVDAQSEHHKLKLYKSGEPLPETVINITIVQ